MKAADVGFFRWLFWALLSWQGKMKRLPYIGSFFCLVLTVRIYVNFATQWLAVNAVPPPAGVAPDSAYMISLATSQYIVPFLLPICYIYIVLDIKRLRSIGLNTWQAGLIALVFSGVTPFVPIVVAPAFQQLIIMTTFAYHAILAVIPAREDRISPLERKYRTWRAIATGNGTPRRLPGKAIKSWRIVKQGPAKKK
jgi:hypothetical protein